MSIGNMILTTFFKLDFFSEEREKSVPSTNCSEQGSEHDE